MLCCQLLTGESRNGPVASDAGGEAGQLEDKRPSVRVCVSISGSDVDSIDVPVRPLTDLRLFGNERWGVVINIYQIDLQCARAAGWGRACEGKRK